MSTKFLNNTLCRGLMLTLAALTMGCQPATTNTTPVTGAPADSHGHGGDSEPVSLEDAVQKLQAVCTTIKDAFAKNDPEAAHGPLHDVGHLLEHIPEFLEKSNLDDATKAEANKAVDNIFASLNAVDEGMHGGEGKKYADVSETIDAGLKTLSDLAKPK